jgi:hypothetical protein
MPPATCRGVALSVNNKKKKKKKKSLGWVVNGGRRHAGQQEDLSLRGHRVKYANRHLILVALRCYELKL